MSSTHREFAGDYENPYYVTIQHCEEPGCDEYLGVNYPSDFCDEHRPTYKGAATNPVTGEFLGGSA